MQAFGFHPIIARWFEEKFGTPTEPQQRGWPAIQSGSHTLIAAPTGSGKTLAAFFASLDRLFRLGLAGELKDETHVVYVSPLKALSNDIHKNLDEPLAGIRAALLKSEGREVDVRAEVRTGDTPAAKRQAIARRPPHILVTTPESLYLLLTSASGRKMLSTVRTVIVDEIHALVSNRRGSHLSLTLERLAALAKEPLQRIGLSATQKPIELVAGFLVGKQPGQLRSECVIVDAGYKRKLDLGIEVPGSPLEAVMSNEVWAEVYNRIADLIEQHKTTLVFVNTRRLAERVTHHLCERLGKEKVTSHHGSLSAKLRLEAEDRLKRGELKALVATASLELGIDIGSVDLVCQLAPTRSIANLLQRVGRASHQRGGLPKGRLFPLSRDELVECVALVRSIRRGELDALEIPEKPLDVLAQQIVACAATEDWEEEKLFELVRSAYPYRHLSREEFQEVVRMVGEGFSTKRGRRAALIHYDGINHRVRARKGAGLVALTSGGAIPETGDYRVVLEPEETFIGTVNEDFAIESMAGDIFQLGNASWKILRVNSGQVRVQDAHGQPPSIPFWLGEAPGRTNELSEAVARLREEIEGKLQTPNSKLQAPKEDRLLSPTTGGERADLGGDTSSSEKGGVPGSGGPPAAGPAALRESVIQEVVEFLMKETGVTEAAGRQLAEYFIASYKALGVIPSRKKLVLERFFDESGGMQLVIHSPFGSRINRAWGLALRKRFCRSFNFELQAAATDDAIVLSLGTQHSFPLEDVFRYLHSNSVREILVQALLDAPMFPIRWRWNATRALALPRQRGGRKIPAPLQRMESENLLAAVFPDQLACLENIVGDRQVPDHPLVKQTIDDCLVEAMDIDGLIALLKQIEEGKLECIARDLPEPSPMAHEILNARPYAFLDNAPLEERRTHAVYTRRASDSSNSDGLGILDAAAIEKVCEEAWPQAANADELHDALLLTGAMTEEEVGRTAREGAEGMIKELVEDKRILKSSKHQAPSSREAPSSKFQVQAGEKVFWMAAERASLLGAVLSEESDQSDKADRSDAVKELLRGRMEVAGPVTARYLVEFFELRETEVEAGLAGLEAEGFVLRGKFHPGVEEMEWCDRRLLARIHRLTINWLRAEIQPVSIAQFQRFLLSWQRVEPEKRAEGPEGVHAVLELLDGYQLPAGAWEPQILASRVKDYTPQWLDQLCFTGRIGWGRLTVGQGQNGRPSVTVRSSPISIFTRENVSRWLSLAGNGDDSGTIEPAAKARETVKTVNGNSPRSDNPLKQRVNESESKVEFSPDTRLVLDTLANAGALFFGELVAKTGLLPSRLEQALAELVATGSATSDSFEGLRALLVPQEKRERFAASRQQRRHRPITSLEFAGRWYLLRKLQALSGPGLLSPTLSSKGGEGNAKDLHDTRSREEAVERFARVLLHRYGIVFRRLLEREAFTVSWYELGRVCRRLEARGEIRGGHFVSGISGEQFALPEAIGLLRSMRKQPLKGELLVISGADPLNLAGILTPGARLTAITGTRILLRDGVPIAALEGGKVIHLEREVDGAESTIERSLKVGKMPAPLRRYYK
jgi:ATP-dependent Lhr-like helicase